MAHAPKEVITQETDARFWAQTHYKPGRRLNPADPADRAMAKVWLDIWAKVKAADRAGELVLTYNHPEVEQGLDHAELAGHATDSHVEAAAQTPDPAESGAHADAAAQAASAESEGAQRASAVQPPTVSPILADAAAAEAAASLAGPSGQRPVPVTPNLPADHPAVTSEAARPVISPGPQDMLPAAPPATAPTPRQHVDVARAGRSPSVAARVHEHGRGRIALGTLHPHTISEVRGAASQLAMGSPGLFVGVLYAADDAWSAPMFRSGDEAAAWYDHMTNSPGALDGFRYVAYFDKTPGAGRGPVAELFGSSRAIASIARPEVRAAIHRANGANGQNGGGAPQPMPASAPTPKKGPPYLAIAAGGAAIIGIAAILSAGKRRERSPFASARRVPAKVPQVQIFEVGKR